MEENKRMMETLRENERIMWQGKAASFGLTDGTDGKKAVTKMLLALVVGISVIAGYAVVAEPFNVKIVVGLAVVTAIVLLSPVLDWRNLQSQRYYLTNQRAFLVKKDGMFSAMELSEVDQYKVFTVNEGSGCIVMGSKAIAEGTKQLRWRGTHILTEESSGKRVTKGMVFYSVANPQQVTELLRQGKSVAA